MILHLRILGTLQGGEVPIKKYKSPDSWRAQRKTNKKEIERTAKKEKKEGASSRKSKKV